MAATDILTEGEALTAINVTTLPASQLTELATRISAVSQAIDAYCGPVVARTVTEVHDGGYSSVWLREAPVLSITSVTEFDGTTSTVLADESAFGTVGGSSGFALAADRHSIERRSSGSVYGFPAGGQVQVVYSAGRFADTAAVTAKWKEAASDILRRVWKREGSAWAYSPDFYANTGEEGAITGSSFFRAVEPMIAEWLWDERRAPAIA